MRPVSPGALEPPALTAMPSRRAPGPLILLAESNRARRARWTRLLAGVRANTHRVHPVTSWPDAEASCTSAESFAAAVIGADWLAGYAPRLIAELRARAPGLPIVMLLRGPTPTPSVPRGVWAVAPPRGRLTPGWLVDQIRCARVALHRAELAEVGTTRRRPPPLPSDPAARVARLGEILDGRVVAPPSRSRHAPKRATPKRRGPRPQPGESPAMAELRARYAGLGAKRPGRRGRPPRARPAPLAEPVGPPLGRIAPVAIGGLESGWLADPSPEPAGVEGTLTSACADISKQPGETPAAGPSGNSAFLQLEPPRRPSPRPRRPTKTTSRRPCRPSPRPRPSPRNPYAAGALPIPAPSAAPPAAPTARPSAPPSGSGLPPSASSSPATTSASSGGSRPRSAASAAAPPHRPDLPRSPPSAAPGSRSACPPPAPSSSGRSSPARSSCAAATSRRLRAASACRLRPCATRSSRSPSAWTRSASSRPRHPAARQGGVDSPLRAPGTARGMRKVGQPHEQQLRQRTLGRQRRRAPARLVHARDHERRDAARRSEL